MMRSGFQTLMTSIQDCQKPVIAALNGTAAGGGAMLVLAADLVIAADTAKIIQVFVRRGLVPDAGVAYLLPRIVGMHKAKELVFFGDDLGAEDAELGGACFWFELPLPRTEPPTLPATNASPQPPSGALAQALRILVVDDETSFTRMLKVNLELHTQHTVAVVNRPHEALSAAHKQKPDLVLMDIHMPDMDGLAATRHIRALPGCAGLPIIAMTASVLQEERDACLLAGMNAHLGKPLDTHQLFLTLLHWLDRQRQAPSAPEPTDSHAPAACAPDSLTSSA